MTKWIINDTFVTSTEYEGPPPAWMHPSGLGHDDIQGSVEVNFLGREKAIKYSLNSAYDIENVIKPVNQRNRFYALAGFTGFEDAEILKHIPYAVPLKINFNEYKITQGYDHNKRKNKFILDKCNQYAKKNLLGRKRVLVNFWLLESLIETPIASCLWDKAIKNPVKYIVLYNNKKDEAFENQRLHFERVYNRISKIGNERKREYLFERLAKRCHGPKACEDVNFAYRYISVLLSNLCVGINCSGLSPKEIAESIKREVKNVEEKDKASRSSKA